MTAHTRKHREDRVAGANWLAWACAAALTLVSLSVGAGIGRIPGADPVRQDVRACVGLEAPVALVVGNTAYDHFPQDTAGKSDAIAVAGLLGRLGFEVVKGIDLERAEFAERVADFHQRSRGCKPAALFYYSGYAYRGSPFANGRAVDALLPVDISNPEDVGYGIALDDIQAGMEGVVNLLVLDASLPARPRIARLDTLIAYAGELARVETHDGTPVGAFTKALLTTIAPGKEVLDAVQEAIRLVSPDGDQRPWMESSLRQPFRFPDLTALLADKLDARLVALIEQFETGGQEAAGAYGATNSIDLMDGRVAVRIIAESEDHVEPLKRLIETAAHGSVQATFENNIYASLPVEVIATFARVEAVYRVDLGEAVVAPPEQDSVPVPAGEGPAASQAIPEDVREWWLQIKDTAQPNHLEAFIEANPEDRNAHLARVRLKELWATAPAGTVIRDFLGSGGRGPEMVVIPAGRFRMGCLSNDDACYGDEMPVHDVTIPVPFALSAHEVTFEDYDRFTHPNEADDAGWGRGARPVINVSWDEAKDYVEWLSSETGATYRLPSEAEWEYAARAGSATKYSWGNEIGANRANCDNDHCGDQWKHTAPVGSFPPNGFGLYDMHGNVWEWVEDCWNGSYAGAPSDGVAWVSGDCAERVLRGGSWVSDPRGPPRRATGSGTPPASATSTSGSVWPGRSPLESLHPYVLGVPRGACPPWSVVGTR